MKILIVAPSFWPDKNVGAVRMTSLARYLIKKGEDVFVLTNIKNEETWIDGSAGVSYVTPAEAEVKKLSHISAFNENKKRYAREFCSITDSENIDAVIVSGGPFYTFAVAAAAKKRRIPSVLDFRDPWFLDVRADEERNTPRYVMRKAFQLLNESRAIRNASSVVTVTDTWTNQFRKQYPLHRDKFCLIENGYDDELLDGMDFQSEIHGGLTVGIFGKLFYYTKKYSDIFLEAVKGEDDLQLLQIGTREPEADRYLAEHGLPLSLLRSTGFMEYEKGIELLTGADVFLIIDERKGALGTKVYDYIYLNRPVLYVGPDDTALAEMIGGLQTGRVCTSVKDVKEALKIFRNKREIRLPEETIKKYARSSQNEKWHKLLKSL